MLNHTIDHDKIAENEDDIKVILKQIALKNLISEMGPCTPTLKNCYSGRQLYQFSEDDFLFQF